MDEEEIKDPDEIAKVLDDDALPEEGLVAEEDEDELLAAKDEEAEESEW